LLGYIEGFGIVYLEAAATQLPVLAGNSGGAVEAVIPGVTGELVDKNNLFAEIHKLLSSKQIREDYGRAGRNWIIQNFSIIARGETLQRALERRSK
jgi:phosphatidylinositol alpha-1,6-mannosyltransferase